MAGRRKWQLACKVNFNADKMHDLFKQHLDTYKVKEMYIEPLKLQLGHAFELQNSRKKLDALELARNMTKLKARLRGLTKDSPLEISRKIFIKRYLAKNL
jgi:hypothetical protein